MLITILISLTFSQQDIKHVGVCGSSANFPQKYFPEKITQNKVCICHKLCMYGSEFSHYGLLYFRKRNMANIIDFRFKLHDKSDDEIFIIKIAWQTLVKDAIPTIKKGMETLYKQVPDEIKLCVDNPKELTTELKPDDMISKHFNIDHIEEGLILIYPVSKPPSS